jgi:hypothetical protein
MEQCSNIINIIMNLFTVIAWLLMGLTSLALVVLVGEILNNKTDEEIEAFYSQNKKKWMKIIAAVIIISGPIIGIISVAFLILFIIYEILRRLIFRRISAIVRINKGGTVMNWRRAGPMGIGLELKKAAIELKKAATKTQVPETYGRGLVA